MASKRTLKIRLYILCTLALVFAVFTALVWHHDTLTLEQTVIGQFNSITYPTLITPMKWVSHLASAWVLIPTAVSLLLLPATRKQIGIPVAINTACSAGLNHLLKSAIKRPRPDVLHLVVETGYAFPSGHTMNGTALCVILALSICRTTERKEIKIISIAFAMFIPLLIGLSRIYLGVHNVMDVLAGLVLGTFISLLTDTIYRSKSNLQ